MTDPPVNVVEIPTPTPEMVSLVREVYNLWQGGQQQDAIDRLNDQHEILSDDVWPRAWLLWLHSQQGEPGYRLGIPIAERLIEEGAGFLTWSFLQGMTTNLHAWPSLIEPALRLTRALSSWPMVNPIPDFIQPVWNLIGSGQDQAAAILLLATTMIPPATPLSAIVDDANSRLAAIKKAAGRSQGQANRVSELAAEESSKIAKIVEDLKTKAQQAEILVDSVTSVAVNERFETTAKRNEDESKTAFKWGMWTLAAAVAVTALPLVLHYLGMGPDFSALQVLGAHASATLALGTLAGVLLSRARGRDRARRRNSDLATAMGTIIVYSGQIHDPEEKQRFMQTMGQLVLIAHLQVDQSGNEDSTIGLGTLLSAVRTPPANA